METEGRVDRSDGPVNVRAVAAFIQGGYLKGTFQNKADSLPELLALLENISTPELLQLADSAEQSWLPEMAPYLTAALASKQLPTSFEKTVATPSSIEPEACLSMPRIPPYE